MEFEWDEDKRRSNLEVHGVDFIRAARIFEGPVFEAVDNRLDYGEVRIRAIGQHEGQVYVVIYTMRGDVIRLISAWKAGKYDRENYYAGLA